MDRRGRLHDEEGVVYSIKDACFSTGAHLSARDVADYVAGTVVELQLCTGKEGQSAPFVESSTYLRDSGSVRVAIKSARLHY